MNRNTARMWAPTLENRCETAQNSAWPMIPPRVSNEAARQNSAFGTGPGPSPAVPAASASVIAATRQMTPVRIGRTGGRSSRISTSAPAATRLAGQRVSERAEHELGGVGEAGAERPAGPVEVHDPGEEDPDRDQRQRQDVDVVWLELGTAGEHAQRRPARERRAGGALGRRFALGGSAALGGRLLTAACGGGHVVRGSRFDAARADPPRAM